MSRTHKFVTSGTMVLFALALTLAYLPAKVMQLYEAAEITDVISAVLGLAINGLMCVGAWMLAVKGAYAGARVMRIGAVIRQWVGWFGIAGIGLLLFLRIDGVEWTGYDDVDKMIVLLYVMMAIVVAIAVVEIFVARNISKMMKDIMYRMADGRPYGYLVTLDRWGVVGLVVTGLMAALSAGCFVLMGGIAKKYGITLSMKALTEMGTNFGSIAGIIFDIGIMVFLYIMCIRMSRAFCSFVIADNAEKDAADNGEEIPEVSGEETA